MAYKAFLCFFLATLLAGCGAKSKQASEVPRLQDLGTLISITPVVTSSVQTEKSHVLTSKADLTIDGAVSGMRNTEVYSDGDTISIQQPGGDTQTWRLKPRH